MKRNGFAFILSLFLLAAAAGAADPQPQAQVPAPPPPALKARMIQVLSCDDIPASVPFDAKPMQYEPGFRVWFLIEGADLVGFKPESLAISAMIDGAGKDISKKRNGSPAYKMGSFPKVSDDGKFAVFEVDGTENEFGRADQIKISGAVTMLTSTKRSEAKGELDLSLQRKVALGPFQASVGAGGIFGNLIASGSSQTPVLVDGDLSKLIDVKLFDGATELKHDMTSSSGSQKVYYFHKGESQKPTIVVSYWEDLKEVVVPFGPK